MKWMTKDELEKLTDLLESSKEEALAYAEEKSHVKSKKKRVRKKIRKQILTELSIMEEKLEQQEVTEEIVEEKPEENDVEVDVSDLPVTFVLRLGKEYFEDLDVVKSYYTKTKEAYYKNRELLTETVNEAILTKEPSVQHEIITKIKEKQK